MAFKLFESKVSKCDEDELVRPHGFCSRRNGSRWFESFDRMLESTRLGLAILGYGDGCYLLGWFEKILF